MSGLETTGEDPPPFLLEFIPEFPCVGRISNERIGSETNWKRVLCSFLIWPYYVLPARGPAISETSKSWGTCIGTGGSREPPVPISWAMGNPEIQAIGSWARQV